MSKDTELAVEESGEGQENLRLWKSVDKTPPNMTKLVSYGKRKYTTIDPQWQLRVATALWGPYGDRWGMRNLEYRFIDIHDRDEKRTFMTSSVVLKAEFFYPVNGKEVSFEILNDDKWTSGDDTLKKLITNTRSKALSMLGFSADVFLGKFDDAKYVQTLKALYDDQDAFVSTIATAIRTAKDLDALSKCRERLEEIVGDGTLEDIAVAQELKELIIKRKRELTVKA